MKESSLQSSALRYLNDLDNCIAYNLHGSAWSGSGRPDIVGCYRGVAFAIELKRPGEIMTRIQEYELCKWRAAGAIGWIASRNQEIKEMIDEIDKVVTQSADQKRAQQLY